MSCSWNRGEKPSLPSTGLALLRRYTLFFSFFFHSLAACSKYRTTKYSNGFICQAIELVAFRKAKNLLRNYVKETILDCASYLTCVTRLMNQGGWHGWRRPKFLLSCLDSTCDGTRSTSCKVRIRERLGKILADKTQAIFHRLRVCFREMRKLYLMADFILVPRCVLCLKSAQPELPIGELG